MTTGKQHFLLSIATCDLHSAYFLTWTRKVIPLLTGKNLSSRKWHHCLSAGPSPSQFRKSPPDNQKGLLMKTARLCHSHDRETPAPDPRPASEPRCFSFSSEARPAARFHLIVYFYHLISVARCLQAINALFHQFKQENVPAMVPFASLGC